MSDTLINRSERATSYGVASPGGVTKLAVLYESLAICQTAPPHEHQLPYLVGFRLKGHENLVAITKNMLSGANGTVTLAVWDALVAQARKRYDAAVCTSLLDRAREKSAFEARPHWPSRWSPWAAEESSLTDGRDIHPEGTTFGPSA